MSLNKVLWMMLYAQGRYRRICTPWYAVPKSLSIQEQLRQAALVQVEKQLNQATEG